MLGRIGSSTRWPLANANHDVAIAAAMMIERGDRPEHRAEGEHRGEQDQRQQDRDHDFRARRPVGPREKLAAEDLVDDLGVHLDARLCGRASGVATKSRSPTALVPIEHDAAVRRRSAYSADLVGIEKFGGGDARPCSAGRRSRCGTRRPGRSALRNRRLSARSWRAGRYRPRRSRRSRGSRTSLRLAPSRSASIESAG